MEQIEVGGIATTEVCNISCVMCPFNGPLALRKEGTLTVEEVEKFVSSVPKGPLWFASTGEFFMDPNALQHLRTAVAHGHEPCVLTNGQLFTKELIDELLEIGVRQITISVDSYTPENYQKVRRGGELNKIIEACAYLRSRKKHFPDLRVEINNVLFKKTFGQQDKFIEFWRGKVDSVNFNAEYYDTFKFRNTHFDPGDRVDCQIRVFLLPNGQMSPCCAMNVHQHTNHLDWLPHIQNTTPDEALEYFKKLYADRDSPLGKLCPNCDWWILWKQNEKGETPYIRKVDVGEINGTDFRLDLVEVHGVVNLKDIQLCNSAQLSGTDPVTVTTSSEQWSYGAVFPLRHAVEEVLHPGEPLYVQVEATVDVGRVGIGIVSSDLGSFVSTEHVRDNIEGKTSFNISLESPATGQWLVVRNTAGNETASRIELHAIRTFRARPCHEDPPSNGSNDFVPVEVLGGASSRASMTSPGFAVPTTTEVRSEKQQQGIGADRASAIQAPLRFLNRLRQSSKKTRDNR